MMNLALEIVNVPRIIAPQEDVLTLLEVEAVVRVVKHQMVLVALKIVNVPQIIATQERVLN
jgi:hypothetical protein